MTGMLKTYTKDDVRPKREEKDKKGIDSYNPGTSSRELNPYWKDGGTGLPQTSESFRKSKPFLKPVDDDDDYYSKPKSSRSTDSHYSGSSKDRHSDYYNDRKYSERESYGRSSNWKKQSQVSENQHTSERREQRSEERYLTVERKEPKQIEPVAKAEQSSAYLSDEKMNKLAAKIVKAEILGDDKLITDLKSKLEAAREYRKQNPDAGKEDDGVMLMSTNSFGNSRPLTSQKGDPQSRSNKRKAETHVSGERAKYFGDDDKYNLAQMVSLSLSGLFALLGPIIM